MTETTDERALFFLQGGGEMGRLTRAYDWGSSSLGDPAGWPQSLKTTVNILLSSKSPMFLWWGPQLIQFYNDAYRPSFGKEGKHPKALGQKGIDCWPEIWSIIFPLIEQVLNSGEATWSEDQLIPIFRNNSIEDVYWTFGYSPVRNDDGNITGVLVVCTETTRSVQMVRQLRESEQRFQRLISQAPVGIIVLESKDLIVKVVNDAYCDLIGKSKEEIFGEKLFDHIPEAEQYFRPILESVMNNDKEAQLFDHPYFLIFDGKRHDGYLNIVYHPYHDDKGKSIGVMTLVQEVTDQVNARKELERSEQQVRALVESAPFPIGVYTGREMRIALANQAILDVWGKGNDVIGKTYYEVLPELDSQNIYPKLDAVFNTGKPFHGRNQRVDLVVNGKLQPYYFNYSFSPLFDASGNVYGVMNTAAEITDLQNAKQQVERSEENLRNMILQAPVAMCILTGPEHRVEVANDMMIELWGKKKENVMNKPIFEALPDAREQGLEKLLDRVFSTGETFKADERPVDLLRNGKWEKVYQNFVYEPYKGSDGQILGVLAVTIDVSEQVLARRKIEETVNSRTIELATANEHLKRSNSELAQFAYIASHDLQEPVRKVSTFAQMLDTHLLNPDERTSNYLNKIKKSSSRMLVLIRDVLAYSELSRINQSLSMVDLQEIVDDICTDYELLIAQKQATIRTRNLPVIRAIPLHMSQLFGNLISNALKFSRAGVSPLIEINADIANESELAGFSSLSKLSTYHRIEVKDNGIGFDIDNAKQIFNIFQRLHGKSDYEGTGIGLALCQKIVQNHHGEIYTESEPGKGSSFVILLPA